MAFLHYWVKNSTTYKQFVLGVQFLLESCVKQWLNCEQTGSSTDNDDLKWFYVTYFNNSIILWKMLWHYRYKCDKE